MKTATSLENTGNNNRRFLNFVYSEKISKHRNLKALRFHGIFFNPNFFFKKQKNQNPDGFYNF